MQIKVVYRKDYGIFNIVQNTQREMRPSHYMTNPPAPMLTFNQEIIPVPPIGTPL
jgi:hypothetical protein